MSNIKKKQNTPHIFFYKGFVFLYSGAPDKYIYLGGSSNGCCCASVSMMAERQKLAL
jgi:hypothetical protein